MKKNSGNQSVYPSIKYDTVDHYHSYFPRKIESQLNSLRQAIKEVAPEAEEVISYNMPAYKLNGNVVYYAAYKHHIGLYPGSLAISVFKDQLNKYKTSKGAIQFPLDQPLPLILIKEIIKYKVAQNQLKIKSKK